MYGDKNGLKNVNQCSYAGGKQTPISYHHVRTAFTNIVKEQTWKNAFRINIMKEVTKLRLEMDWMSGRPTQRAVTVLMSCTCRKSCNSNTCEFILSGRKCSHLFSLTTCADQPNQKETFHVEDTDDDGFLDETCFE